MADSTREEYRGAAIRVDRILDRMKADLVKIQVVLSELEGEHVGKLIEQAEGWMAIVLAALDPDAEVDEIEVLPGPTTAQDTLDTLYLLAAPHGPTPTTTPTPTTPTEAHP